MTAPFIRAEDFDVIDRTIVLGVKNVDLGSLFSFHIEKRTSLELIGYISIFLILLFAIIFNYYAILPFIILGPILFLGARREILRPYVLVMEFYQIGRFEVRGFTKEEAIAVEDTLDSYQGHGNGTRPGQRTGLFTSGPI